MTNILPENRKRKVFDILEYVKCFKTLNTCLLQTGQIQIRLLLKKQSDQDLPCLLLSIPALIINIFSTENRKRLTILFSRALCS